MATKTRSKHTSRTKDAGAQDPEERASRRALWSGSISFGLLQIPVTMHTAEQSTDIQFHQLDRHDLAPIHYQRENSSTGKPVEWKDIVRGYEYAPGEYVVIEDGDLAAANVEATQTIDLEEFVDVKSILPTYFERPYYLAPGKRAEKAYALFREALRRKKVVAIGKVVIRTRQHLCALFPQDDVIILELLRFAHELRTTEGLALPKKNGSNERELAMAEQLIEAMQSTAWKPEKYRDQYHDDVLALIDEKVKTGKVSAPPKAAAPRSNVVDLMSVLRQSIEAQRGSRAKPEEEAPAKAKKRAPAKPRKRGAEAA